MNKLPPGLTFDVFEQMFEHVPLNVIRASLSDLVINYVNSTTTRNFRRIEPYLPVTANGLIGARLDIFHEAAGARQSFPNDRSRYPHAAMIPIGPELLELHIELLEAPNGRDQIVMSWSIVTEKVMAQRSVERQARMLDQMPVNVMLADPNSLEIVYVNETSVTTLRRIEHLLPVKADQVVGSCIDIFHKQPAHQRALLADSRNLPHYARIRLGDEELELKVSAIEDGNGGYANILLCWSLLSDEQV